MSFQHHRAVPASLRSNGYGHLKFPKIVNYVEADLDQLDMADTRYAEHSETYRRRRVMENRVTKSNKELNARLQGDSEYRRTRNNLSYKPFFDLVGEDFPIHPEFLFVMEEICAYYNLTYLEVEEYMRRREKKMPTDMFSSAHVDCAGMLVYILSVQYRFNIYALSMYIGLHQALVPQLMRIFTQAYAKNEAIKADFQHIMSNLYKLQPV